MTDYQQMRERAEGVVAGPDSWERTVEEVRLADDVFVLLDQLERAREALRPIVEEFDLWASDANNGEFRLWDLDRLVCAIVNARAALARLDARTETDQ